MVKALYEENMVAENISLVECISTDFREDEAWKYMIVESLFRQDVYERLVQVMFNIVDMMMIKLHATLKLNPSVMICETAIQRINRSFNKEIEFVAESIDEESDSFSRLQSLQLFSNFIGSSLCEVYIQRGGQHFIHFVASFL